MAMKENDAGADADASNWTGRVWSKRRFGVTWWHWQVTGFRSAAPWVGEPKPTLPEPMWSPYETGNSFFPRLSEKKAEVKLRRSGEKHVRSATRSQERIVNG